MIDLQEEHSRREALMRVMASKFADDSILTSEWLTSVDFEWGPERLKDRGRGIWNPADYSATLTIVSDPESEYDDGDHGDSLYRYSYEKPRAGSAIGRGSNLKLRAALEMQLPIIMLRKVADQKFVPIMPVYVVKDEPEHERFLLALSDDLREIASRPEVSEFDRRYAARMTRQRLHQPEFRGRIMLAYETRCAVCVLKHGRLLDAAHIVSDRDEDGVPTTSNGIALCKIHHAAYDHDILGISADFVVHINRDVLAETDGPMLKHGLQEMQGRRLHLPRSEKDQPDKERLALRFSEFLSA